MWKMYACEYKVVMRDGRIARFCGEAIQAKSWDGAQGIADRRGRGETVTATYG
ncbi:hypothetical protein LCGC14_0747740 [marine sediment metagenome]|uniref:Uncharacterized protein n=1 Tax=marine sediment metagenome TaxID=412755 RepID=A0A0F9QPQ2_9ZZZZ